jgi:hypothetical protein
MQSKGGKITTRAGNESLLPETSCCTFLVMSQLKGVKGTLETCTGMCGSPRGKETIWNDGKVGVSQGLEQQTGLDGALEIDTTSGTDAVAPSPKGKGNLAAVLGANSSPLFALSLRLFF